jgi:hypothetical protein
MQYLPDPLEQEWLLSRLRRLISRGGHDPFVSGPIVAPTKEFFPDPWEASVAGLERVTRRLLQYAGLGHLGVELSVFSDAAETPAEEGDHPYRSTVGVFAGIRRRKCRFAVNDQQSGDPEALAGVMAHEVAHAYRAHHNLVQSGQRHHDEEELLTDLTTVYLGFGVLAVNNAHRYRSSGEQRGALAYHSWRTSKIGYLPAQAFSFLLAVQLAARETDGDFRRRLARHLETDQAAYVKAALREIEEQGLDLSSTLGLPPRETWEPPRRLEEILLPLPLAEAVPQSDSREPAREENRTFNAGRPIFRLLTSRQPLYAFWSAMVLGFVGGALWQAFGDTAWGFAFAVPGLFLGLVLGRRTRRDVCSDPDCRATLEPAAVECPGCAGTISGRIKNANERLEREEQILRGRKTLNRPPRR